MAGAPSNVTVMKLKSVPVDRRTLHSNLRHLGRTTLVRSANFGGLAGHYAIHVTNFNC